MQDPQHIMVLDCSPGDFSSMGSTTNPPRKEQVLLVKMAHGCAGGASVLKAEKDLPNGGLHLQIGIKYNRIGFGVTQPDR